MPFVISFFRRSKEHLAKKPADASYTQNIDDLVKQLKKEVSWLETKIQDSIHGFCVVDADEYYDLVKNITLKKNKIKGLEKIKTLVSTPPSSNAIYCTHIQEIIKRYPDLTTGWFSRCEKLINKIVAAANYSDEHRASSIEMSQVSAAVIPTVDYQ